MRRLAALALLATTAQAPAPPQTPESPTPAPQTIRMVKPNLYVVTGAGGNSTVWVSNHGFILVDDKIAGAANFDALVAAISSVTPLPVRAVFNTHHHFDHVGNNAAFLAAGVIVVGSEALPAALAGSGVAPPSLVFSRDFSIILDTGRADAHHYRAGHTGDDVVVVFPAVRAVALGGLVVEGTPTFDYEGGANVGGWIATLDDVARVDFDTAVPGRGAVTDKAGIAAFRDRLAMFRDRARAAIAAGATRETLIDRVRVDDLGWAWSASAWPAARRDGLWREMSGRP